MKILVAGGYDTQNLGDYASFLGLQKVLKQEWPDVNFCVLSRHPEDPFSRQFDVEMLLNLDHSCKAESVGRIFNGFNEGDSGERVHAIRRAMEDSDCLVLGNGRLFIDISLGFMRGPLSYFALLVALARFLDKPVILSSVTLVRPQTGIGEELLHFILSNSQKILVREEESAIVAREYITRHDKIEVLPDLAFALSCDDADFLGLPEISLGALGVNFRGVSFDKSFEGKQIDDAVNHVVDLIDRTGKDIVFCSQCTYDIDNKMTDDRYVNNLIYSSIPEGYRRKCYLLKERLTLAQTLGLYSNLDHVFTFRRHGFILALTQGTSASLICDEVNTNVVRESIPLRSCYLNPCDPFVIPETDFSYVDSLLTDLRRDLSGYIQCFRGVLIS